MVVVIAHVRCRPDGRRAFLDAAHPLIAVSRDEQGCLDYTLLEVVDQPNHFVWLERRLDGAAIEAHLHSAPMATYRAAIAGVIQSRWATVHHTSTGVPHDASPRE